jgi:hypothetical protein
MKILQTDLLVLFQWPNPDESRIATAESGGIIIESLSFAIPNPASAVKIYAVHIGYKLRNRPNDNPPNATCDMASPKRECFLVPEKVQ